MLKQRGIGRRTVLKTLGAYAVVPLVGDPAGLWSIGELHPLVPQQPGSEWQPTFLTPTQNDIVVAISERIIPATDTPGAEAAHVNQYIDWVLGNDDANAEEQRLVRDGLARMDQASQDRFDRRFAELDARQQDDLLTPIAEAADAGPDDDPGAAFFRAIKQRTVEGYYRSEVGMRLELGYDGNTFLTEFEGCTHPDHLNWEPPSGADGA